MSASNQPSDNSQDLRSFGRRKGRKLTRIKQQLVDELLPTLHPPSPLPVDKELWLEIGFGGGEHFYEIARTHPERFFIGAEPYLNGVAMLLVKQDEQPLDNIAIVADDVRPWLESLDNAALDGIYILFPDPWPKKCHHKRRLINARLLDLLASKLKAEGTLRIATDHVDYSAWIMEHLLPHPAFEWNVKSQKDWHTPYPDWQETRYQHKTTEQGRLPIFLEFTRQAVAT